MEEKKVNESGFVTVEAIIPSIKPLLPLESRELYKPVRPAHIADKEIMESLKKSFKLREFFKPFNAQIIVEIGPGELITGYKIASFSGARAYIGVEPYNFSENLGRFLQDAEHFMQNDSNQIPRTVVKADALSFLKRLPDKSVSVFASQLESVMKKEYETSVSKEIERVLHPMGALIQYNSNFDLNTNLFKHDLVDPKLAKDLCLSWSLEKYQPKT